MLTAAYTRFLNPSIRRLHASCRLLKSNFEYSVVIPESSGKYTKPRQVVFLFGWTNSVVKNLKKYSEIYEKEGHAVISCCPSAYMVYGLDPSPKWEEQADVLIDNLYEQNLQDRPVFFHVFSGGIYMYYLLCKRFEKERHRNVKITGVVMDSTLASHRFSLVYRAMRAVAPGNVLIKGFLALTGSLVTYLVIWSNLAKGLVRGTLSATEETRFFNYAMICRQPNFGPQLFLFSKVDRVIDYKSVQNLIEMRKQRGVDVYSKMWEDSPHVRHFQVHREEYLQLLDNFRMICERQSVSIYDVVHRHNVEKLSVMQKWVLR